MKYQRPKAEIIKFPKDMNFMVSSGPVAHNYDCNSHETLYLDPINGELTSFQTSCTGVMGGGGRYACSIVTYRPGNPNIAAYTCGSTSFECRLYGL